MYVVGLFSQVTCTPKLISKSVQLEISHSPRLVGVPLMMSKVKKEFD